MTNGAVSAGFSILFPASLVTAVGVKLFLFPEPFCPGAWDFGDGAQGGRRNDGIL